MMMLTMTVMPHVPVPKRVGPSLDGAVYSELPVYRDFTTLVAHAPEWRRTGTDRRFRTASVT